MIKFQISDYLWRLFTYFSNKPTAIELLDWDFGLLSNPEKSGQVYFVASNEYLGS